VKTAYKLTIPNVPVSVRAPDDPVVLSSSGHESRPLFPQGDEKLWKWLEGFRHKLEQRDWRNLRARLINLDLDNREQGAEWLNDAGYVPPTAQERSVSSVVPELADVLPEATRAWLSEGVTPEIVGWLRRNQQVFKWLLELEHDRFRRSIQAAFHWLEEMQTEWGKGGESYGNATNAKLSILLSRKKPRRPTQPDRNLIGKLNAPMNLDPGVLARCLMGAADAPSLSAFFRWDAQGKPSVVIHADTPMEAIGLSIHVDRNFSARRWICCANPNCVEEFEQKKSSQHFCSTKCRDFVNGTQRYRKVKLLQDGDKAWNALTAGRRKGRDRWEWIVARAKRKGKVHIDPAWAERVLSSSPPGQRSTSVIRNEGTKKGERGIK